MAKRISKPETGKLMQHWSNFVLDLCCTVPTAYVQIRKMFNNITWEVPFEDFDGIDIPSESLAYASWKSKFRQLDNNYLNQEEFEKCNAKAVDRKSKIQTCVTARFGNKEKKKESMGFCMQTISLNLLKQPVEGNPKFVVEVYYRSTEVGQKFLADLKYLHERVLPILLKDMPQPDVIRFRFCTMYMSSMFLPILLQYTDPVKTFDAIAAGDSHWWKRTVRQALYRWLHSEENPYNWRTQKLQWESFDKLVRPGLTEEQLSYLETIAEKE